MGDYTRIVEATHAAAHPIWVAFAPAVAAAIALAGVGVAISAVLLTKSGAIEMRMDGRTNLSDAPRSSATIIATLVIANGTLIGPATPILVDLRETLD